MTEDGRGHYKIFLGMAAGVGKTYRMLQEGRAAKQTGRDVVIGYLEPHRRAETLAQADGLEIVPRRTVEYRGATLDEMDLPAVLERAPGLCLIDELAHTNPPGLEHAKRYEDIDDVLSAGTDVFSTVNVQHLESLNDQIAEMTGVRVRETFPDRVLTSADEVVLIDLTPEALIQRLREGKVYPPSASRARSQTSSASRTSRPCARSRSARSPRTSAASGRARERLGTREDLLVDDAPRRSASACSPW